MTREEKIAAIYKEMANKELTFGCKIITNEYRGDEFRLAESDSLAIKEGTSYRTVGCDCCSNSLTIKEIIGHPVMIGDVLDWIGEKEFNANAKIPGFGFEDSESLNDESKLWLIQNHYSGRVCAIWLDKRTPIEDQSDECIDYVYSLIQKD